MTKTRKDIFERKAEPIYARHERARRIIRQLEAGHSAYEIAKRERLPIAEVEAIDEWSRV